MDAKNKSMLLAKLEKSKKAVLKRIAEDLKSAESYETAHANHSSHASGFGKGHTSYVSALRLK